MIDCLFCKIVNKDIPADIVFENESAIAFKDISPQAPIHLLVIPKSHVRSLIEADDPVMATGIWQAIREVAAQEGLNSKGFRVVTNIGSDGGQTVGHLHFHLLGGRPLSWPPG